MATLAAGGGRRAVGGSWRKQTPERDVLIFFQWDTYAAYSVTLTDGDWQDD